MIQTGNKWEATPGYAIIRVADGAFMGVSVYLGEDDSIDNYTERPITAEEQQELDNIEAIDKSLDVDKGEAAGNNDDF